MRGFLFSPPPPLSRCFPPLWSPTPRNNVPIISFVSIRGLRNCKRYMSRLFPKIRNFVFICQLGGNIRLTKATTTTNALICFVRKNRKTKSEIVVISCSVFLRPLLLLLVSLFCFSFFCLSWYFVRHAFICILHTHLYHGNTEKDPCRFLSFFPSRRRRDYIQERLQSDYS